VHAQQNKTNGMLVARTRWRPVLAAWMLSAHCNACGRSAGVKAPTAAPPRLCALARPALAALTLNARCAVLCLPFAAAVGCVWQGRLPGGAGVAAGADDAAQGHNAVGGAHVPLQRCVGRMPTFASTRAHQS
jgi:hypothetical protein